MNIPLISVSIKNINEKAIFINCDIHKLENIIYYFSDIDDIFYLEYETNVM